MRFYPTKISGAYVIELEPVQDERGFFARTFCQTEFEDHGLCGTFVQCSSSYSLKKGTLRGMHYQVPPHEEVKLVWCLRGSIYDVIVDLRLESETFRHWVSLELNTVNGKMLYIPGGCAHGLLTLEDDTEVFYQMSEFYHPESAQGFRWDDPAFRITWPFSPRVISANDLAYPDCGP